jgi:hypothetical protein
MKACEFGLEGFSLQTSRSTVSWRSSEALDQTEEPLASRDGARSGFVPLAAANDATPLMTCLAYGLMIDANLLGESPRSDFSGFALIASAANLLALKSGILASEAKGGA